MTPEAALDEPLSMGLRATGFVAGFEQVLDDLHVSGDPNDLRRHNALITGVVGIFNGMNNSFMHSEVRVRRPPQVPYFPQSFLSRFHALLTLNKDALFEQHLHPWSEAL
ncbi:hypothetical protein SAMN05216330_11823 [Bradyrhizobium sp. Ghvi]|uniref:hypothetical protein n=1 Tax=Bradyrhizobium sp. Ghvi TaxID=1855319 RepID=UPI0008E256B5|nr:hypothetical protein [Bradyrhizobium sp. Ghvi]SFQ18360.1 hypothetical protein SAMN05216330_11823 [Bradyrhizobium sp. Ghvi]